MRTLVFFRTGTGRYALPVEATLAVRPASGLVALPDANPDVVGVLPGDPPLSVLSSLGPGHAQVLVVEEDGRRCGLLVEAVTGLRRVPEEAIGAPPAGQGHELVSGVIGQDDELVLLADPSELVTRL
jgi:chemotaxis signal transduction protein